MENYKKDYTKVCLSIDTSILNKTKKFAKSKKKKLTQMVEEALSVYIKKTGESINNI